MPRYFFHIIDGRALMDAEGTELAGIDEARGQAIQTAGEMLRHSAGGIWSGCPWQMTVADANGDTLFTLRFGSRPRLLEVAAPFALAFPTFNSACGLVRRVS